MRPKEVEERGKRGDNSFHTDAVNVTSQEPHASHYDRPTDRPADFPIIEGRKEGMEGRCGRSVSSAAVHERVFVAASYWKEGNECKDEPTVDRYVRWVLF